MQGTISFDGTLSGGITGSGGGGSEVTITPVLTEGEKIADYSIDGESGSLYAPEVEALPSTIVIKALRKYNDDTQTKILTITTLDTENGQEVSQDIFAPSPVQCWYTPGLEQDYVIGQFTYGGVTQNVYIPNFQRPLTAGANINIDQNNVISATGGGSSWNYSTTEVNTGQKWIDGKDIYCRVFNISPLTMSTGGTWYPTGCVIPDIDNLINVRCSGGGDTFYGSITADYSNNNINLINFRIAIVDTVIAFYTKSI